MAKKDRQSGQELAPSKILLRGLGVGLPFLRSIPKKKGSKRGGPEPATIALFGLGGLALLK